MIALFALVACQEKDSAGPTIGISDVNATVSEHVATVVTVTWTTSEPTTGHVAFADGLATPEETEAATEHSAVLLGLHAGQDVPIRVVLSDGTESEPISVTTGNLPTELPALTVTGGGNDRTVFTSILGGVAAAVMLNPDGTIGWYHVDTRGLDLYRVRLSVDGQSILYNAASVSGDPADEAELVRVSLDGSEETTIPVPLLAHDFVEHADGTIAAIVVEYGEGADGEELRGDKLVEIAPDGTMTDIWSAWDCIDPATSPGDEPEAGWTYTNALDWDPDADKYLLGMRAQSSILQVDRATGTCDWILGGDSATIEFAEGSDTFLHQHQFERLGDHLLLFDNDGAPGRVSRVLEYALDTDAGLATEVWSYTADPTVYSLVLGDVTRLDDGDTIVTWSVGGQIDRVDADGVPSQQVNLDLGYAFGFATIEASPYR